MNFPNIPDDIFNMHQSLNEPDDAELWALSEPSEQLSFDFVIEELAAPPLDDYPVVVKKPKEKICICKKCGDIFPRASPNQKDGTFKCWSCRNY